MGQKVIPTSLRLGLNRHFDSCYYQEMHYSDLVAKDLSFQSYAQSLFQRIGISKGRIFSNIAFKKQSTYMFVFPERLTQQLGLKQTRRARTALQSTRSSNASQQNQYSSVRAPFQSTRFFDTEPLHSKYISKKNQNKGSAMQDKIVDSSLHAQIKPFHFQYPQQNLSLLYRSFSKPELQSSSSDLLAIQKSIIEQLSPSARSFFLCSSKALPISGKDFFYVSFLFLTQQLQNSNNNIHSQLFREQLLQYMSSLCLLLREDSERITRTKNQFGTPKTSDLRSKSRSVRQSTYLSQTTKTLGDLKHFIQQKSTKVTVESGMQNQTFLPNGSMSVQSSSEEQLITNAELAQRCTKLFHAQNSNALQQVPSLESRVSTFFAHSTAVIPLKIPHFEASAHFVARYLAQQLERKKPFRRIMKQIIAHIKMSPNVKGVRLMCAGRLGGVEMARIESRKWGETSLHVFSNQIDYSAQTAYTVYGLIGVKVWISYGSTTQKN